MGGCVSAQGSTSGEVTVVQGAQASPLRRWSMGVCTVLEQKDEWKSSRNALSCGYEASFNKAGPSLVTIYGHITLTAPYPVRSVKLSRVKSG